MEVDDWLISLVFEAPDGSFFDEPRRYRARLDEALALARRDAALTTFGRSFRGFSQIEIAQPVVTVETMPRASHVPTSPERPLSQLLQKHGVEQVPETVASDSPRHALALDELTRFPWWDFQGAFGVASDVGLDLLRCASTSADEAKLAAETLGEAIAHQQQLFPVTAHALPWMVTLLESPQVSCRPTLAAWLEVIADSASDARDAMSRVVAFTARLVARELSTAIEAHQACAKEVMQVLRTLEPRLTALRDDALIGERVRKVLSLL